MLFVNMLSKVHRYIVQPVGIEYFCHRKRIYLLHFIELHVYIYTMCTYFIRYVNVALGDVR